MRNEAPKFVQVRVRRDEKRQWVETARHLDLTLAQLVRRAVRAYMGRGERGLNASAVVSSPSVATFATEGEAKP